LRLKVEHQVVLPARPRSATEPDAEIDILVGGAVLLEVVPRSALHVGLGTPYLDGP